MDIQPAHVNQIRQAADGRFIEISADAGGVVDDLKKIDQGLGVRFAECGNPPYWHVYHKDHDGCPHNKTGGSEDTYLVTSVQAEQTRLGVWTGLDQRVVRRIMRIGHSTYDYARELQRQNQRVSEEKRQEFHERIGGTAEEAAHAIRKDTGSKYRGRTFVPRDLPS